jgi:hypothetical protein
MCVLMRDGNVDRSPDRPSRGGQQYRPSAVAVNARHVAGRPAPAPSPSDGAASLFVRTGLEHTATDGEDSQRNTATLAPYVLSFPGRRRWPTLRRRVGGWTPARDSNNTMISTSTSFFPSQI